MAPRIVFTTYAFPDDSQAFIEHYVRALARVGTDVTVVATAGGESQSHDGDDQARPPIRVASVPWDAPRHAKALRLFESARDAARHHSHEYRRLVAGLGRRHGLNRALLAQLYV